MTIETMAVELLRFMEKLPRRAPQNWLGEFGRGELFLLNYLHVNSLVCPGTMRDAMQTSTARIAAALNNLERKGWVKREPDERDHRRKLVHLTPAGTDYIEEYRNRALENIIKLLTELGPEDAGEYFRITKRMAVISRNYNFDF